MGDIRNPKNANKAYRYLSKSPELTPDERNRIVDIILKDHTHKHLFDFIKKCDPSKEEIQKVINLVVNKADLAERFLQHCQQDVTEEVYEACISTIIKQCECDRQEEIKLTGDFKRDEITKDMPGFCYTAHFMLNRVPLKQEHKTYFIDLICHSKQYSYCLICGLFIEEWNKTEKVVNEFSDEEILKIMIVGMQHDNGIEILLDLHHNNDEIVPGFYTHLINLIISTRDCKLALKVHQCKNKNIKIPFEMQDEFDSLVIGGKLAV